jgi:hypothetical protein
MCLYGMHHANVQREFLLRSDGESRSAMQDRR